MSAEQAAEFATIVGQLMSTDSDVRQEGEARYRTIPPHERISFLLALEQNQQAPEDLRSNCDVLLTACLRAQIRALEHNSSESQAYAGAVLSIFCGECPRDKLKNYVEALLGNLQIKLTELVNPSRGLWRVCYFLYPGIIQRKKLVLEQLVTVVGSVAKTLQGDFVPFYERFMPCMIYIMQNANHQELRLLRSKTILCVSYIGLAVGGGDKFIEDAVGIMDLLLRNQVDNGGAELSDDDTQLSYMITAWANIFEFLGERCSNYLPMVMAPVLRTASMKFEPTMMDVDGDEDWDVKLEDKARACQILVCSARVMKNNFRPYVDKVVQVVISSLKFNFEVQLWNHDDVRSSCSKIVPHLLRCVDDNPNDKVALWNMFKNDLLIAAEAEPESDVKRDQLFAIASCIKLLPREAFDQETINKITNVLEKIFLKHFDRSAERADRRKDEDHDEVIEQELLKEMEDDNSVLTKAVDVLHSLLKVHGANYLPLMEAKIIGLVVKLMSPDRYWQDRQWALCICDYLIEFTGTASAKYKDQFIPLLLQYLGDQRPEVRQAASYGCGVMAQYGQDAFVDACKEALPGLVRIVNDAESRGELNIKATENAISAVAKIIKFCPSAVSMDEVIPLWISWLPIWEDKEEMDSVYGLFCDLVESNNPIVFGPNGSNLPRVVHIIAETFYRKSLAEDSTSRPRIANIIRTLQMSNPAALQQCTAVLDPERLAALQAGLA